MPGLVDGAKLPVRVSYAAHSSDWDLAAYSRAQAALDLQLSGAQTQPGTGSVSGSQTAYDRHQQSLGLTEAAAGAAAGAAVATAEGDTVHSSTCIGPFFAHIQNDCKYRKLSDVRDRGELTSYLCTRGNKGFQVVLQEQVTPGAL